MTSSTPDKVTVVTGASSGIGAATARALAADGYRVRQELGTANALINNAGVMLLGPFDSDQREDYRQMIEVNLLGAITTTEVFLEQLKDGGGDIIDISSAAGRTARSGNGVYAATKWGINGWSESLRQELLPDVRVTLVEPGVVATELPNHITHADTKQRVQQLYDKAEVTAEDVAEIIAFSSAVRAAWPSTRSCCGQQGNSDAPQLADRPSDEQSLNLQAGLRTSLTLFEFAAGDGTVHPSACPTCGQPADDADPIPAALRSSLKHPRGQLENLAEGRPSQRGALVSFGL